jgi:hypothetical protein
MLYRVLPHKVFLPGRDAVSFMDGEDRSGNSSLTFIGLFSTMSRKVPSGSSDMSERQPNRPPIPEPQHTSNEGGNSAPGTPPVLNERAKPPPEAATNKPRLTPEERAEKKRKYKKDYRKNNKDKVNEYQRRHYHEGPKRTNEKLIEYQRQRYWERVAMEEEESANDPSTDFAQIEQRLLEALQIFPSPLQKK